MAVRQKKQYFYGTGRRKTAVARVFLCPGKGKVTVNKLTLNDYFKRDTLRMIINQPLVVTDTVGKFDLYVTVKGGGHGGQAGAVRLGITRALIEYDDATSVPVETSEKTEIVGNNVDLDSKTFRRRLRLAGLVTRDSRIVERKKVGRPKARKGPQYSKR